MSKKIKTTLQEPVDEALKTIKEAQDHHKKFRDDLGKLYNYHHQMISHLQDQIDKLSKSKS